ncbi:MAG: hypothetical protein HYW26_03010 [Candidatus Aenigmarchaeota archaeon]|nr:hypothetical protein [Candidatus Aenigmarchaeota archaeon]
MLFSVLLVSGCVQQQREIKEITIPGHPQIYSFSNDLREVLKVPVSGKADMQILFLQSSSIDIVFNGTSTQDNAYFRVVLIDMITKMQAYASNEGKQLTFRSYYFVDSKWYNSTNGEIEKPGLGTAIWLKGPETGAEETSVRADESIITVQGTSYKNLTLAGDRLVLVVFGIDRI